MGESHTQVLVIGAGPTGLFFAGELARHGVRARVIDAAPEPHTQTRATGVQPAVLEVLHRAGIAEPFLAEGVPVRGVRILDRERREAFVNTRPAAGTPYPFTLSIPQWRTEQILAGQLRDFDVEVERGVTAHEIIASDGGVRVRCVDEGGREQVVHADYLVGAGGAHSPTRHALHEQLEGITYPRCYLVADVRSRGIHDHRQLLTVAISSAGMLMLAELPHDRTLVVADIPDGTPPATALDLDDIRAALAHHLQAPFEIDDLRWASMYHTHRRLAPRFSQGRCFLAGDAAHLCSPLGGEGMNSGILDGASLAWKLAAVLRRNAKPTLLDAYHPERSAVARQVLASSEAMYGFYYGLVELAGAGRPLVAPPEQNDGHVTATNMLDLALNDSPIVGAHGDGRDGALAPGARFTQRTRLSGCRHHLLVYGAADRAALDAFAMRWTGIVDVVDGGTICGCELAGTSPRGALLIRPDGYVGFHATTWTAEARDALDALLQRQFRPAP